MPLIFSKTNEECTICKVGGSSALKNHLADLGILPGSQITVLQALGGNLIVRVKDTRFAISREMAQKILVT